MFNVGLSKKVFNFKGNDTGVSNEIKNNIWPDPLIAQIFSYLTMERDLQNCGEVCTQWLKHVKFCNQQEDQLCKEYKIFNKTFWINAGFNIGNVPRLPKEIIPELLQASPIFIDERTLETSHCLLYPNKINGKPLEDMISVVFKKFLSCELAYQTDCEAYVDALVDKALISLLPRPRGNRESCWFIITKNFIPMNDNVLSSFDQLIQKTNKAYKKPNLFEVLLSSLMNLPKVGDCIKDQTITFNSTNSKSLGFMWLKYEEIDIFSFGTLVNSCSNYMGLKHSNDEKKQKVDKKKQKVAKLYVMHCRKNYAINHSEGIHVVQRFY